MDEDPVVLQEVEIRLDLGDAPEFGIARNGIAGLQHEARRGGSDVAQLDDLDRAAGIECESCDHTTVRLHGHADLQRHGAADVDDRFVGEAQALELHAAGNFDEEDLAGSLLVILFEGTDDLERLGGVLARIAVLVGPVCPGKRDGYRTGDETAADVIAEHGLVGFVHGAVAVVVDAVGAAGKKRRRRAQKHDTTPTAEPAAREREFARRILEAAGVERDAAGGGIAHIDPGAADSGQFIDHDIRQRTGRIRRGCVGRIEIIEAASFQREMKGSGLERAGVPVAELRTGFADPDGRLAVVQGESEVGGIGASRIDDDVELRIEIRDARKVDAVGTCRQRDGQEVDIEVAAVVQQVGIDAVAGTGIGQRRGQHHHGEALGCCQIAEGSCRIVYAVGTIGIDHVFDIHPHGVGRSGLEGHRDFAAGEITAEEITEGVAAGQTQYRDIDVGERDALARAAKDELGTGVRDGFRIEHIARGRLVADVDVAVVCGFRCGDGQGIGCGADAAIGETDLAVKQGQGDRPAGVVAQREVTESVGIGGLADQDRCMGPVEAD